MTNIRAFDKIAFAGAIFYPIIFYSLIVREENLSRKKVKREISDDKKRNDFMKNSLMETLKLIGLHYVMPNSVAKFFKESSSTNQNLNTNQQKRENSMMNENFLEHVTKEETEKFKKSLLTS